MKQLEITVFTTQSIKAGDIGLQFFATLGHYGLSIEKISTSEPVRQAYSNEIGIMTWTHEDRGCYVEGKGMLGTAGGVIGKSTNPRFFFQTQWWDCPDQVNLNWVSINVADNWAEKNLDNITALFKDMINIFQACYGFVGYQDTVLRQHVTGTLKSRLPGIFWLNYFGPVYVKFFSKDKIEKYAWSKSEVFSNGLLTTLSSSPLVLLDSEDVESNVKRLLGEDSFGDVNAYLKNPRVEQRRNVPELT